VDSFQHPDAKTIRPRWAGDPFDLHACVQALFTIKLPELSADLSKACLVKRRDFDGSGGRANRVRIARVRRNISSILVRADVSHP
jgi:hypothetical protein